MGDRLQSMFLLGSVAVSVTWLIASIRRQNQKTQAAADRWRKRQVMLDGEFLRRCAVPDRSLPKAVSLAARRTIAAAGTVPPETIWPDDAFAQDLGQLPFWDSLDWLGFLLEVEIEVGSKLNLTGESVIDNAVALAGGQDIDLRVHHVIKALMTVATRPHLDQMFDAEVL